MCTMCDLFHIWSFFETPCHLTERALQVILQYDMIQCTIITPRSDSRQITLFRALPWQFLMLDPTLALHSSQLSINCVSFAKFEPFFVKPPTAWQMTEWISSGLSESWDENNDVVSRVSAERHLSHCADLFIALFTQIDGGWVFWWHWVWNQRHLMWSSDWIWVIDLFTVDPRFGSGLWTLVLNRPSLLSCPSPITPLSSPVTP